MMTDNRSSNNKQRLFGQLVLQNIKHGDCMNYTSRCRLQILCEIFLQVNNYKYGDGANL